jgi:outer membrane lipoprotein
MIKNFLMPLFWCVVAFGCSAIPSSIEKKALPEMPFPVLIQRADQYIGRTVILGGYLLEVQNLEDESRMLAIQVPLDADKKPKTRDLSRGLIKIKYNRNIDSGKYTKNSKITAAGVLLGSSATETLPSPYPYVEIKLTYIRHWD